MHRWTKVSTGSRVATRTFGASSTVSALSKSGAMSQRISRHVVPSATRSQCRSMVVAPPTIGISATPWSRKPFQLAECSGEPGVEERLKRAGEVVPPHQHVDVGELAPARLAVPHGAEHRTLHDEERLAEGGRDRGEGVVGHELLTGGGETRPRQASSDGCGDADAGIVETLVEHADDTVDAGGIEQSVEVDAVDQAGDALGRRAGVDDGEQGAPGGDGSGAVGHRVGHGSITRWWAACSPVAEPAHGARPTGRTAARGSSPRRRAPR